MACHLGAVSASDAPTSQLCTETSCNNNNGINHRLLIDEDALLSFPLGGGKRKHKVIYDHQCICQVARWLPVLLKFIIWFPGSSQIILHRSLTKFPLKAQTVILHEVYILCNYQTPSTVTLKMYRWDLKASSFIPKIIKLGRARCTTWEMHSGSLATMQISSCNVDIIR